MLLLTLLASCGSDSENPGEEDYVPHPGPGRFFCQWETEPAAPEGTNAHPVSVRVPLGERSDCTEIPPEEADEALYAAIDEECDRPVEGFLRGCYLQFDSLNECSFGAFYFSACEHDEAVE